MTYSRDRKVPRLSKHCHLVNTSPDSAYFCFLCSPQNKPISTIVLVACVAGGLVVRTKNPKTRAPCWTSARGDLQEEQNMYLEGKS